MRHTSWERHHSAGVCISKSSAVLCTLLIGLGSLFPAFVQAQGIPTYDAATVYQLAQQLQQMQRQYETLKRQYDAITGSYRRGTLGLDDAIRASSVVPGSWQEVVAKQRNGEFGEKQSSYEQLIRTLPSDLFNDPNSRNATSYRLSTDSVRAALSGGEILYSQVQTHLNNLARMSNEVDSTANIKDAQDLQNRISTENGMMQTALGKLNAMNMNLQANMLNQQTQANASTQTYFRKSR